VLRKHKWKIPIVIIGCATIFAMAVLKVPLLEDAVKVVLQEAGMERAVLTVLSKVGLTVPPLPEHCEPVLPPDRVSARRHVVAALHEALARDDLEQAAVLNSILSQEAFQRAYRALKAWEKVRDPGTGLVPKATHPKVAYWDTRDTAADLFPFLLLASQYLDKDNERLWLEALANERQICGPMPCKIHFRPTRVVGEDLPAVIFGASEYAKDGLLAVAERSGRGPWFERLEEVENALIDAAYVQTEAGKICASGTEENGEMLQVLSRLYWATGNERYLEMAERIGEAYLFDIFPKNQYLPATHWDFARGQPMSQDLRFRDHGSEIIPGLAELYLLEKIQGRPQAARYREPLKRLLDAAITVGRTEDGLWYNAVDVTTYEVLDRGVVDTWGYILNGYLTFDMAEGTDVYADEIERVMRAAAARKSVLWEGQSQDGYADSIESMLYLLPWFDIPECHRWVDDEIEVMFGKQLPSGFIEEWYLDGNFIRTSLLYATYKTQGITFEPWRENVRLGAAYDTNKKDLYVYISADADWEGILKFDLPRHRTIWNLPFEYPRLNETPEWFVVEPQENYVFVNLGTGEEFIHSGQQLGEGLAVTLDKERKALRLKVSQP